MAKKEITLIKYHMNCNPDYQLGHAIIAGQLAQREFKTFEDYKYACDLQGISNYNEESFNDYIEECKQTFTKPKHNF